MNIQSWDISRTKEDFEKIKSDGKFTQSAEVLMADMIEHTGFVVKVV